MKVYIAADMEGVSGVVHPEHTGWSGKRHHEARKWMTEDINAAVAAAIKAGATEVLVSDGHSNARNVLLDLLHPEATLMWGRQNRRLGQMEGLDESFDAVLMIGFHARASTLGVLNHTINSGVINEIRFNGEAFGEVDINAAVAAEFGVPVAMVSGDATAIGQAKERFPHIETATTMEAVGTYSAKILSPAKAHQRIREAVTNALKRLDDMQPVKLPPPITLEMVFKDTAMADAAAMMPYVERLDPLSCAYQDDDLLTVQRACLCMISLASLERWESTV